MFSSATTNYRRYRYLISLSLLAFVIVISAYRIQHLAGPATEVSKQHWGFQDFRDAIYFPSRSFSDGQNPYDAEDHLSRYPVRQLFPMYSPLTLVLHQPLSRPGYSVARWVYFGFTIVLMIGFVFVSLRLVNERPRWDIVFLLSALLLFSRPGHMNLALGQSTLQVSLFCLLALVWAGQRNWRSGFMLALATFKPTFGCLIFVLMLARRNLSAALIGLLIGGAITLPLLGYFCHLSGGIESFVTILTQNSQVFDGYEGRDPATSFTRLDAYFLIGKWTGAKSSGVAELVVLAFLLSTSSIVLFLSSKRSAEKTTQTHISNASQHLNLCLILLTTILAVYHHAYDWLLLAPILVLFLCSNQIKKSVPATWRMVVIGLVAIPGVNYLSTNTMKSYLDSSTLWPLITSANAFALFAAWLIVMTILVIQLRRKHHLPASDSDSV